MSRFLGIDLGTQSLKAIIYDAESRQVIASGSCELELISRADGSREQHASWWIDALHQAVDQLDPAARASVSAIGVSGQQHGFVPVAASGDVLAPVKLWCDTSTARECDEIATAFGGQQACIEQVGNAMLTGYTAPKVRWLRNQMPDAYAALATILLPHDYLNFYLTGERFTEAGDASGTGLLDIRTRQWHPGMVAALDAERDLHPCLPPLIRAGETGGRLRDDIAARLGLPTGIPLASGGGDNMMAALATGNVLEGRLTMSLGTSGTLFATSGKPCIDTESELAAFCSSTGNWLPLLCTMNCTVATELGRDLFGMNLDQLEQALAGTTPGAGGISALPYYNGERTPNLPNGRGCLLGLNPDNMNPENILRASMEAAIFGMLIGLEAFARNGVDITEIRLTGGAAKSPSWRQAIADIFGLPVKLLAAEEGAALGAALNAMLLGHPGHADAALLAGTVDEHVIFVNSATARPDSNHTADYQAAYQQYRQYLNFLQPAFK